MNEQIKIEIVTPLELLKSKETKMSVLPSSEGELGIMSRHTPLMTLLNRGVIKLFDENNSVTDQIAVDGGVADVSEEGINAQVCIPKHNLEVFKSYILSIDFFSDIKFKHAIEEGTPFSKLKI